MLTNIYAQVFQMIYFLQGSPSKLCKCFCYLPCVPHAPSHFTFFDFIILITFGEERTSKAPFCSVSFSALLFPPSQVLIHSQSTLFLNAR